MLNDGDEVAAVKIEEIRETTRARAEEESERADLVRGRRRLPVARLLAFGVCWTWLETAGVLRAFGLWVTGRARDERANYQLMRWWADALMRSLEVTIGIDPHVEGVEALAGGNAVVISRHASLADSLLSAWASLWAERE